MFDLLNQSLQLVLNKWGTTWLVQAARKLKVAASTCVVAVAVTVLPLTQTANAAELGEMRLLSAQGEHLSAEVAIGNVSELKAASLSVGVADAQLSKAAGLVQTANLPFLWAELRQRAETGWYVQLLSSDPIIDPYNEIIIELAWADGSYLREYALRFGGSGTTRLDERGTQVVNSIVANSVADSASAEGTQQSSPAAVAASANIPATTVAVKRGDTLLQIVRGLDLPANVTQEQAMWGVFDANPHSFSGSPHQLRAGATLNIPPAGQLRQLSQQTAVQGLKTSLQLAAVQATSSVQPATTQPASTTAGSTSIAGTVTDATTSISVRDPSIPLYQPTSDGSIQVTSSDSALVTDLSLTRVVSTDSEATVVERQQSRSRVEQTLQQLSASIAEVRSEISGVETSVSSLSENVGSNVGRVEELSSLINEVSQQQSEIVRTQVEPGAVESVVPVDAAAATTVTVDSANLQELGLLHDIWNSTYLRSLALLALAAILALFLVLKQLVAQRRRMAAGKTVEVVKTDKAAVHKEQRGREDADQEQYSRTSVNTKTFAAPAMAGAGTGPSILRQQEEAVDAPTALSWFREHLRSGRVSEQDLVKALRRYPNRQDLRLRLMERYANRQEVESFAQLAREMFHLTRGRNKEWPRAIQLGLALELEMESMEPHLVRPFEAVDFGVDRDIESPYSGDSTLQFPDHPRPYHRSRHLKPVRQATSTQGTVRGHSRTARDVTLDATLALQE